jgi:hypothetical protein
MRILVLSAMCATVGALPFSAFASLTLDSKSNAGASSNEERYDSPYYSDLANQHSLADNLVYGTKSSCMVGLKYGFGQLHERVLSTRDNGGTGSYGAGLISVGDEFTATSNTLAYGTPIVLTIHMIVHVTFAHPANWSTNGYDDVNFSLQDNALDISTGDLRDTGVEEISVSQKWNVGGTGFFNYSMNISGHSAADPGGSVDVNALNTGDIYFTSNTPGVSFVSGCGLTYASQAVPEPNLSVVFGVAGLGLLVRKRVTRV